MLRKFSAECGQTPLGFLQHARVDTAKRLLEADDASVSEVMERVGYLDPGSFRRLFTDQVGVTPAVYRRQFRASTPRP
jgi:AraC-like DNA-binding protein